MSAAEATAPRYLLTVTFQDGKVGRREGVRPLEVAEHTPDAVARAIHRYASRYLLSRGVDTDLDMDEDGTGEGVVAVGGFRVVARFTVAPTPQA